VPAEPRSGWGTVVLVEGFSDLCALEALATRGGRDLYRERVNIVPMGGATNIGHFLDAFGPRGLGVRLAGLCDAAAEPDFRRGLQRAGLGTRSGRKRRYARLPAEVVDPARVPRPLERLLAHV
jgi:hypothetical protein